MDIIFPCGARGTTGKNNPFVRLAKLQKKKITIYRDVFKHWRVDPVSGANERIGRHRLNYSKSVALSVYYLTRLGRFHDALGVV